jgi:exodeoxyribonuclease V alpha subunit
MEIQNGIVTKVIWRKEGSDRAILAVRYEGATGLVPGRVAMDARDIAEGDWYTASGHWKEEQYRGQIGHIFQAKSFRPDLPATADGAREFLGRIFSPQKHGVTAEKVAEFVAQRGPLCCREAEQNAAVLLDLTVDQGRFRDRILTDWSRRISNRRAVVLMEGAGVDKPSIGRILDAFRDTTWEVLRSNPYRVSRVPLVGFENADRIGGVMKIPKDDRRRLDAAFTWLMDEAKMKGSTAVTADALVRLTGQKFDFGSDMAKAWLKDAASRRDAALVVDRSAEGFVVQLPELFRAEAYIARAAVRMIVQGRHNDPAGITSHLDRLLESPEFARFDAVQRGAIATAVGEPISVLTGGPGTGKTTVTKAIADLAETMGETEIILAAPTGKAAKRMQEATGRPATTIHRMLRAEEEKRTGGSVFRVNRENPLPEGCFVIVDEASMLDVETMGAIFDAMPPDGRLLLVGDRNQLPSVGPGNVLSDLLHAERGGAGILPATELVTVYRQKANSAIAHGAAQIKDGLVPPMDGTVRGGLTILENSGARIVDRISHLLRVGGFVREKLGLDPRRDVAILCPQAPGTGGTWEINKRLSAELNPEGRAIEGVAHGPEDDRRIPLPRTGDRVMMTENDDENDVMNGDVGTILDAVEREGANGRRTMMRIAFDCHVSSGIVVEYPASRWRSLILAYACTVHKSQGSQWPCVILPMTMAHESMLERPLLYTGWTRAQDTLMVIGEREAVEYAAGVVKSRDRGTRLREFVERVADEHALRPARKTAPVAVVVAPPSVPDPSDSEPSQDRSEPPATTRSPVIGLPRLRRPTGLPPLERSTAAVR